MRLLVALIIISISSICYADPSLVSDPSTDPAVTHWQVEIDGVLSDVFTGAVVDYDLVDINPGDHIAKARFGSEWTSDDGTYMEWSEWSVPFALHRPVKPAAPTNHAME